MQGDSPTLTDWMWIEWIELMDFYFSTVTGLSILLKQDPTKDISVQTLSKLSEQIFFT